MGNPCDHEAYRTPKQASLFNRIKLLFPALFLIGGFSLVTCSGGLPGTEPTPTPFEESASVPVTVVATATPPQGGLVVEETEEPAAEPTDEPASEPTVEPTAEPIAEPTESANVLIPSENSMTVEVFDQLGNVYEGVATEDGEDWTFVTPPELDAGAYTFTAELYDENGELVKSFPPRDLTVASPVGGTDEMTDTVDATDEITDTVDATDEVTDTVDATDEVTDTVDATDEVTDTVDTTDEVTDTVDATDEVTDTVDATDEVTDTVDATDEVTDTVDATDEVTDTVDATDEITDTVDATDEITDTVDATDEVTDTVDATDEVTDTVDATDEVTDTVDATDEVTDTVDATDEVTDTVDATDEVTDTVDATDEVTDTVDATDEVTDTVDAADEATETVPTELIDGEAPGVAPFTGENAPGFASGTVLTVSEEGQELGSITVGDDGSYEGVCNLAPGEHLLTFTDGDGTAEDLSLYVKSLADFDRFPDNEFAGLDYIGRPSTYGEVDENNVYTVKSGDMSGQIVARYNTTIDDMFVFNPHIRNLSAIYVGQQMLVPFDQGCGTVE